MKLYEIDQAFRTAMEAAEAAASEQDGLIPDQLGQALDTLEMARDAKLGNIIDFVGELEAEADAINNAAALMEARAKRLQNKADWLRGYATSVMQPGEKLRTMAHSVSVSERQYTDWQTAESQNLIPKEFYKEKITVQLDKKEAEKALELPKLTKKTLTIRS